jgi:AcrR family transcriptional regulator
VSGLAAAEPVDGRQGRTLRSRQAICDAYLDLVQEGVLLPSAAEIAERAGLSRRSVFNHFHDLAALFFAVVEAGMQRHAPVEEIPARFRRRARREAGRVCRYEATAPFRAR